MVEFKAQDHEAGRTAGNGEPSSTHQAEWTSSQTLGGRTNEFYLDRSFASDDCLSLRNHPAVMTAQVTGDTSDLAVTLEDRLARFTGHAACTLWPNVAAAMDAAMRSAVGANDHVVLDALVAEPLHAAARTITSSVHTVEHLSHDAVVKHIETLRSQTPDARILVATQTLFDADDCVPDLPALALACRTHGATLLVAAGRDFGSVGLLGRGYLELAGLVGAPDILVGSLADNLASRGGYVASNIPELIGALRGQGPSDPMSAPEIATALAALDIVESREGAELRSVLMGNVIYLRQALDRAGFTVPGRHNPRILLRLETGEIHQIRMTVRAGRDDIDRLVALAVKIRDARGSSVLAAE